MQSLFAHRFLLRASLAVGNIFAWVFIFHALYILGESAIGALGLVALLYATTHTLSFLLTPLASRRLNNGARCLMMYATCAHAAALLLLAAGLLGSLGPLVSSVWWGIAGFVLFSAMYRAYYFVPYAVERRNESIGPRFTFELLLALVPAAAGAVIVAHQTGPQALLLGASALAFLAMVPLFRMYDVYEPFEWRYGDTIGALFNARYRTLLTHSFLNGVQGAGLLFLWPLAAFLLLGGTYPLLGVVLSLTLLLVLAVRLFVPLFSRDVRSKHMATFVMFSSWIVRFAAFSPVTIIIADVLYHTGVPVRRFGMDLMTLEQAADGAHYIDELTALKEMGFALGRIFTAILVGSLAATGSLQLMFLGGLALTMIASVIALLSRPSRTIA